MKNKLTFKNLRHKLSWLLCLVILLCTNQVAFAGYSFDRIYLDVSNFTDWKNSDATFKVHLYSNSDCSNDNWLETIGLSCCETNIYGAHISTTTEINGIKFERYNDSGTSGWNNFTVTSFGTTNCAALSGWNAGSMRNTSYTPSCPSALYLKGPIHESSGEWADNFYPFTKDGNNFTMSFSATNKTSYSYGPKEFVITTAANENVKFYPDVFTSKTNCIKSSRDHRNLQASLDYSTGDYLTINITYNDGFYSIDVEYDCSHLAAPADVVSGSKVMCYISQPWDNFHLTYCTSTEVGTTTRIDGTNAYVIKDAKSETYSIGISNSSTWSGACMSDQTDALLTGSRYIGDSNNNVSRTDATTLSTFTASSESITEGTSPVTLTLAASSANSSYGKQLYYLIYLDGTKQDGCLTASTTGQTFSLITSSLSVGEHTVKAILTDGTIYYIGGTKTINVTAACTTPTASNFSVTDNTKTYTGSAQTATVKADDGMGTMTVKYAGSTTGPTNVGTYAMTVSVAAGTTFCASTSDISIGTFEITKANQSALTFEGSTQCVGTSVTLSATGGSTSGTITYEVSSGTGTITDGKLSTDTAGDVVVTATRPGGDNYNDVTADATFTFDATSAIGSISGAAEICSGGSATLSISSHTGDIKWFKSTGGDYTEIQNETSTSLSTGALTQTTSYKAQATNGSCAAAESSAATVTVKAKAINKVSGDSFSTTVDDSETKTYTFTQCGYEVATTDITLVGPDAGQFSLSNKSVSGENISVDVTFTPTSTGSKTASIQIIDDTHTFAITATGNCKSGVAKSNFNFTNTSVTYNGSEQAPTISAVDATVGAVTKVYYGGAEATGKTNAGTYAITIDSNDGTKYCGASKLSLGDFVINKKAPTTNDFNVTGLTGQVYDGNAKTVTVAVKSDISGMGTVTVKYEGAHTDAGSYAVTYSVADGTNYSATTTDLSAGTLVISKADQTTEVVVSDLASTCGLGDYTLQATGGNGDGDITFALVSGSATLSGSTLNVTAAGDVKVKAMRGASTNYNASSYGAEKTFTFKAVPEVTGTTPGYTCGTGTVELKATVSAGTVNWYADATGGTALGNGLSWTTPTIDATTSYYAEAADGTCLSTNRTKVDATVLTAPTVTTGTTLTGKSSTGVTIAGSSYSGGTNVTDVGYVYGTSSSPTGNEISCGGTTFTATTISGLNTNTKYYYRAYVKDDCGTSYGSDQTYETGYRCYDGTEYMYFDVSKCTWFTNDGCVPAVKYGDATEWAVGTLENGKVYKVLVPEGCYAKMTVCRYESSTKQHNKQENLSLENVSTHNEFINDSDCSSTVTWGDYTPCVVSTCALAGYINQGDVTEIKDAWKLSSTATAGVFQGTFTFTKAHATTGKQYLWIMENCNNTWGVSSDTDLTLGESITLTKGVTSGKVMISATLNNPYTITFNANTGALSWNDGCVSPTISAQPSSTPAAYCQNAEADELSITASGTNITYQWYSYTNSACTEGETLINDAESDTYTPSTATVGTLYYKCKVTACSTTVASDASGAITVKENLSLTSIEIPATVCRNKGSVGPFTTQEISGATYTWGIKTGSALVYSGGKNSYQAYYNTGDPEASTYVTVYATKDGYCNSETIQSANFDVVDGTVSAVSVDGDASVCPTVSKTYTADVTGTAATYKWEVTGTGWSISGDDDASTVSVTTGTADGTVKVTVTGACSGSASDTKSVTVKTISGSISGTQQLCPKGEYEYTTSTSDMTTYEWIFPDDNSWEVVSGSKSAQTVKVRVPASSNGGTITLNLTNSCSSEATQTLEVSSLPITVETISKDPSTDVCPGESVELSVPNVSSANIQWLNSSSEPISGATSATYTPTINETSTFYAKYTKTTTWSCSLTSDPATVNIKSGTTLTINASTTDVNPRTAVTLTATDGTDNVSTTTWSVTGDGAYLLGTDYLPYSAAAAAQVILKPGSAEVTVTGSATLNGCSASDTYNVTPVADTESCN